MTLKPVLFATGFAAAIIILGIAIARTEGPASRCEERGGHYMVGPGGETACIDPNNFLPMAEPESGGNPR